MSFAFCGSFCTFEKALKSMKALIKLGYDILPIMSENAYTIDTRFGKASEINDKIEKITGRKIIHTILHSEPIGPQNLCDILIIAPCTGNTLAKLSNGITDTSVTMAAKSHLRCEKPVLIALSTNDGLGASSQNLAKLKNTKNIYFVPMQQDDIINKPNSLVANFNTLVAALKDVENGRQTLPLFI